MPDRAFLTSLPTVPVSARAHRTNGLALPGSTAVKIPVDTLDFDTGANMDVVTNHRYNVPATGYYWVSVAARWGNGVSGIVMIYHNGSETAQSQAYSSSSDFGTQPAVTDILNCIAGDYIEIWAETDGSNLIVPGSVVNFLSVTQIH